MGTTTLERTTVDTDIVGTAWMNKRDVTVLKVTPPLAEDFGDLGFLAAPDIESVGEMLREKYEMPTEITISYVWKKKGGKSKGKPSAGYCDKVSGLAKFFAGTDFVIWLAADHLAEADYTQRQYEALIHHELLHAGCDDDLKPIVVGHDVELFTANVAAYGAWTPQLEEAGTAFEQAPLFEGSSL